MRYSLDLDYILYVAHQEDTEIVLEYADLEKQTYLEWNDQPYYIKNVKTHLIKEEIYSFLDNHNGKYVKLKLLDSESGDICDSYVLQTPW